MKTASTNESWMMNVQIIAQGVHFFLAYSVISTVALFSLAFEYPTGPVEIALSIGVIAAAIKEFFYDMRYELPKQTWGDSIMDFAFYLLGGAVSTGVYVLVYHLAHR